jgi:hypothetical protein
MPAITRNQQKMMNSDKTNNATSFKSDNMFKFNELLKSDEMSKAVDSFKTNASTKQWFMDYTHVRLNEIKKLNITMSEYNQNATIEYGNNVPENIRDIENNMYFEQLRLVNEIYYNINVYLEDIMIRDQPKREFWLKLLKTMFIKQKELERSIMVNIEPITDEEISIVKSTLLELEKMRDMAIRLLPANEINGRPVRRSIKAVNYRGMEEDDKRGKK